MKKEVKPPKLCIVHFERWLNHYGTELLRRYDGIAMIEFRALCEYVAPTLYQWIFPATYRKNSARFGTYMRKHDPGWFKMRFGQWAREYQNWLYKSNMTGLQNFQRIIRFKPTQKHPLD